jgi:hypothetical protein
MLFSASVINAQPAAVANASATIVNAVGINPGEQYAYSEISLKDGKAKNQNSRYGITAADFSIDAAAEDVYSITVPEELALRNCDGGSCIAAIINPDVFGTAQLLPNGQKQFKVNSELILNNKQVMGKHSSTPFEVTVNFD